MIIAFFLNLIFWFISFLLQLLPAGGVIPVDWTNGVYTIWNDIQVFSFIVPVNVLLTCLGLAMLFHLFVFAWNVIHWILSIVRGYKH